MLRSTTLSPRLLTSAAAVALAAGVLGAPAASAAAVKPVTTNPQATPTPGFASTGVRTQGCDPTTEPGWVGNSPVSLGVSVQVPAGVAASARFSVRDEHTGKAVKTTVPVGTDGLATIQPGNLVDGRTFAWQAQGLTGNATGQPTAWCHFRVDTTQPSVLSVSSADFPATGTPNKYAGQTGTFTITGTDPAPTTGKASGVACYQYTLKGSLSTGWNCQSPNTAVAAADGSVSVQLKPTDWGTNNLQVQAMDNAGNVSQPLTYSFYAPSNPNPPNTPGDLDADGVPDILVPGSTGDLQVISASATGTAPTSVIPVDALPYPGTTWNDYQVTHRGWSSAHAPADDLFVHQPGNGSLSVYRNTTQGALGGQDLTTVARPTTCGPVACPSGYATDWSHTEQLVSLGVLTGAAPSLLTVEDGNLWLFGNPSFLYRYRSVQQLSTTGTWSGYDLIAPGAAADGSLALWSRERATGALRSYPVVRNADGSYDFSALADPAGGTVVGSFPVADYPVVGSSGDGNGDGRPDLYAVTAQRHLLTFDGVTTPKDLGALR